MVRGRPVGSYLQASPKTTGGQHRISTWDLQVSNPALTTWPSCLHKKICKKWTGYYPMLLYGKVNSSVLIGSFLVRILPYGPFRWKRSLAVYFLFSKAGKFKTSMAWVPYSKQLTNLTSLHRTVEYWPSVDWPSEVRSVLPWSWAHIPQYGPRTRLVRGNCLWKLIIFCIFHWDLWLLYPLPTFSQHSWISNFLFINKIKLLLY